MPIPFHTVFKKMNLTVPLNFELITNGIMTIDPRKISALPKHFDSLFHKLTCGRNVTVMVTGVRSFHRRKFDLIDRDPLLLELGQLQNMIDIFSPGWLT
jgi:hypothetical protein